MISRIATPPAGPAGRPALRLAAPPVGPDLACDQVTLTLPGAPATPGAGTPAETTSTSRSGAALALASLGLLALPAMAGAIEVLVPPAPRAEADRPTAESPVQATQLKKLRETLTPHTRDNRTARSVRQGLTETLQQVETQASSFGTVAAELMQQARELEESDRLIGPRFPSGMCGGSGDFSLESRRWDGSVLFTGHSDGVWTVRHVDSEGRQRSLVDSPEGRTVTVGEVSSHFSKIDGSFESTRRTSPTIRERVRIAPGPNAVVRETIYSVTSAQGTSEFTSRERWERPEITLTMYPQPQLLYRETRESGTEVVWFQNVTVYNNGSTRVTELDGAKPSTRIEPAAPKM
ncbi:MAG: hypothetical protein HY319_00580 [Armatimonadetes bacterium]|nr:hypothetical protein [Armatimonadota bacterium]